MMFLQAITLIICGFTLWVAGYLTATIGRLYMSTQESIDGIVAQLAKAKDELLTEIADVKAQLEAASVPAETVDLTALTAAAQALDDIVPDA
jgi:hypothetical protein